MVRHELEEGMGVVRALSRALFAVHLSHLKCPSSESQVCWKSCTSWQSSHSCSVSSSPIPSKGTLKPWNKTWAVFIYEPQQAVPYVL